jgi:hypothetical protein
MAELKTKVNNASVRDFISNLEDAEQRNDSLELVKIFETITKEPAKMWGPSIIGFGKYSYIGSSKKKNEMALAAFSPRKQSITLYVMPGEGHLDGLLTKLGKHTTSKACLYIKRLKDIDIEVLKQVIQVSYAEAKKMYPN